MIILNDFNTSVERALTEIDPKWRSYDGLIVCGTHTPLHTESMIEAIHACRLAQKPFLGICFGHQLAWIEYCRHVLNIHDATSQEFGLEGTLVVKKRPEGLKVGLHEGETWWSNYECMEKDHAAWKKPANFVTVPFHPEYQSSKDKPHPVLVEFLNLFKHE